MLADGLWLINCLATYLILFLQWSGGKKLAEKDIPTKVEENENAPDASAEGEELLSLESLDSILAEEDPEFARSLSEIGPDGEAIEIYDEGSELKYALEDELKIWQEAKGFKRIASRVLPFLPKLSYQLKMKRTHLRLMWIKWKAEFRNFLQNAGPLTVKALKGVLKSVKSGLVSTVSTFQSFSWPKRLAVLGLLLVTGLSGVFLLKLSRGELFPREDLFVRSMGSWATATYQYDPKTDLDSFYDSTRATQNMVLMKKMIANIRPSESSGPNPMGAFEFYVESAASEVVIEIKDRSPEMEDLFLRTIEEMNFDELSSGAGKRLLCERLQREVNKILTRGKVRRVFIKTAIIKP